MGSGWRKYPVEFEVKSAMSDSMTAIGPSRDVHIDLTNLTKEMSEQPAKYVYYATLAEEEYRRAKAHKFRIHCLEEDLDYKIRQGAAEGGKRMTDAAVKGAVKRDSRVRALYGKYVVAMHKAGQLRHIKDAMAMKKDMLQSIGANTRKEMERSQDLHTLQKRARES